MYESYLSNFLKSDLLFSKYPDYAKNLQNVLGFMSHISYFLLGTTSVVMATTLKSKHKPDVCGKGE